MRRVPAVAIVVAAAAAVLLLGLGRVDTYNPDEPRELEMAREMLAGGDLVAPRLNAEPFLEKPPLFYWLAVAASRAAGGADETPARAVAAVAGILTVLLTFLLARSMMGETVALLAALVLLTSFEFFYIARRAMIDMPLTLATTAACVGFHRGMATDGHARRGWIALGVAALAAALMFKGVVGAGIPGLAIAAWLVARRDWKGFLRHGLIPGAAVALIPVGLWVAALHERLGAAAVREFVVVNNILRFTGGASKGHDNPPWYYLPTLLTDMLPWSVVLPFAIAAALAATARRRAPIRDLLLWFALPFAVLTLASTKRGIYLLPIYPPAAILTAWWLAGGERAGADRAATGGAAARGAAPAADRARRVALWLLFGVMAALIVAVLAVGLVGRSGDRIAPAILGALLAWPVATAWRAARAADGRMAGIAVSGAMAVVLVAAMAWAVPGIVNPAVSARAAGGELRALADAGDRIGLYRFHQGMLGGFLFYSGRTYPNLRDPADLRRHLETDGAAGTRAFALMRGREMDEAARYLPFPILEARRYPFRKLAAAGGDGASGDYVLVMRAPAVEAAPAAAATAAGEPGP